MSGSAFNHQFYETAPVHYTVKLPKICELCGQDFLRIVGSKDKYCRTCHGNWNQALSNANSAHGHRHHLVEGEKFADGGQEHGNRKVCPVATHNPKKIGVPCARAGSGAKQK